MVEKALVHAPFGDDPSALNPELDELDYQLIAALRVDARSSIKALAKRLGAAKSTIASRIQRLIRNQFIRVTASFDIAGLGYTQLALLLLRVKGQPVDRVARELTDLPESLTVQSVLGHWDVLAMVIARNRSDLVDLVSKKIGTISGIESVGCEGVLSTPVFRNDLAMLQLDEPRRSFFDKAGHITDVDLDDLDRLIVSRLREDGRSPLAQIAREASVSEGTIRFRLKRLEEQKRLNVLTVVDAVAMGYRCSAFVGLRVRASRLMQTAKALGEIQGTNFVLVTLSSSDIWVTILARNRSEMASLVHDRVAALKDVMSTTALEVIHAYKYDMRWAMRLP